MNLLSHELMHQLERSAFALMVKQAGGVKRFRKDELVLSVDLHVLVQGGTVEFKIMPPRAN